MDRKTEINNRTRRYEIGAPMPENISGLENLVYLRDAYIDEIPKEIIHGFLRSGKVDPLSIFYKVRKNWFQHIIMATGVALHKGEVTGLRFKEERDKFVRKFTSPEFQDRDHLTTVEEIAEANDLISKFVGDIEIGG